MRYKGLLLLLAPALILLMLGVVLSLRRPAVSSDVRRDAGPRPAPVSLKAGTPVYASVPEVPRPVPASAEAVAAAMEDDRLRSTFQNYRTAVVTGNAALADALRKVLARDRRKALTLARDAVARSVSDDDRRRNQVTLESLER